jgi:hypothetical protein
MSWAIDIEESPDRPTLIHRVRFQGEPAAWSRVIDAWRETPEFRECFIHTLAAAPWPAFYWETPPVTGTSTAEAFEFVLIDSPLLAHVEPEPEVFAEHFRDPANRDGVSVFPNLGGDAVLVAPWPVGPLPAYAHLAAFCRGAPARQQHALWRRVGDAMTARLARPDPVWLSTAGQGVFWLHVRLDDRPKYYSHGPYRRAPS